MHVFNPNITTFQSNCAKGLHFSAFIIYNLLLVNANQQVIAGDSCGTSSCGLLACYIATFPSTLF